MIFFYYLFLFAGIVLIALITRFFVLQNKNISAELFSEALKNENGGHFEAAVVSYENALDEVEKFRFHNTLKNRIIAKIKVLRALIKYRNNFHLTIRR